MKKITAFCLSVAMALSLVACGPSNGGAGSGNTSQGNKTPDSQSNGAAPAEAIHILFGHDNSPGEPLSEAALYWADKLKEVSGGTMILDVYD